MHIDLTGQTVLITGAAGGIGRAMTDTFARAGARLILSDLDIAKLPSGDDMLALTCDVTDAASVRAMVAETQERFGPLDIAINNAGISGPFGPLAKLSQDDWSRLIAVNLTGTFNALQAEIPAMRDGGRILNVASLAGVAGAPGLAAYAATKHGVVGLTRSLAHELRKQRIRVNALCPSFTDTPMLDAMGTEKTRFETPLNALGRFGTAQEMADAALWITSPQNSFMNGQAITLDGGISAL
ncbi:SDR family NAD(P)-dependent oxidoreductase [Sagittula sp. MA-2]|jgi:NAD(P)-dependent dehydrogenase (short-subunit alcohol dehydrogenase family)|uniref:SDR family NAD(P)-dependent oxidoreductase n=1 Tax=Sagittula sp. MA-2 TaxID=3048007 RepID=UPI0024C34112|nr:SDR family NAD(P)-dependent oxidoreductase [Sagittula sp. MA-2]WHZ33702.1 SDR family NAD(P)-dependent oxidoreductase [Sagittula sp. MA-2]